MSQAGQVTNSSTPAILLPLTASASVVPFSGMLVPPRPLLWHTPSHLSGSQKPLLSVTILLQAFVPPNTSPSSIFHISFPFGHMIVSPQRMNSKRKGAIIVTHLV